MPTKKDDNNTPRAEDKKVLKPEDETEPRQTDPNNPKAAAERDIQEAAEPLGRMHKVEEDKHSTGEPQIAPAPEEINPEGGGPREEGADEEGGGIGPVVVPPLQPDLSEAGAATMVQETVGGEARPSEEVSYLDHLPSDPQMSKHKRADREGDDVYKRAAPVDRDRHLNDGDPDKRK